MLIAPWIFCTGKGVGLTPYPLITKTHLPISGLVKVIIPFSSVSSLEGIYTILTLFSSNPGIITFEGLTSKFEGFEI